MFIFATEKRYKLTFMNIPLDPPRRPSALLSLVPILVLVGLLFFTIRVFGSDALEGGSQIVLLTAAAVCCLISIVHCRVRWKEIEKAVTGNITGVATALIILLLIGALSGSWMISGVVPTLIYYGMQLIHPTVYLVSTCVICSIVSVITGSSWTTIATIGIALLGIGQAQGFGEGWIAGAIISGAYFGDKISPLSDTTVLASSVTDTPIFTHIRYMMITTIPSLTLTLLIFLLAGFLHHAPATEQMTGYAESLRSTFHLSPWLLLVPRVTGILIARRVPALITLFLAAALAGLFALLFQPHLLDAIAGGGTEGLTSRFKGLLITFYGSTQLQTGHAALDELVATRGMGGMMNTVWLILCAMTFGGAMAAGGMLSSIIAVFLRFMKRTTGMVASTVVSGLFFNLTTADQYISIMLTGNMFKDIYRNKGYESRLLSRTTEDAVTVTSPLIPWNTCGMTQSTILGISTFTYLPYCFFNLISPLMSITIAALNYKIKKTSAPNPGENP
jgi:NhaC family Na+:H+ antiporter